MSWRDFQKVSVQREYITESCQSCEQWGEHASLVEWFFQTKDRLPTKPFCYWRDEGCSIHWATPAASYENLAAEIEKGPGGQWDEEVRSILEQLHHLFGGER